MKRGIEVGPALLVKRGCCQGGGRKGQCEDGQRTWTCLLACLDFWLWKKQSFGGEGGCCFAQNTLQWLPSREENCNFLAVSLCQISIACGREPWLRCNLTSFHLEKCKKTICLKLSWRIITFIVILILIIADCRKRIFVIDLPTFKVRNLGPTPCLLIIAGKR